MERNHLSKWPKVVLLLMGKLLGRPRSSSAALGYSCPLATLNPGLKFGEHHVNSKRYAPIPMTPISLRCPARGSITSPIKSCPCNDNMPPRGNVARESFGPDAPEYLCESCPAYHSHSNLNQQSKLFVKFFTMPSPTESNRSGFAKNLFFSRIRPGKHEREKKKKSLPGRNAEPSCSGRDLDSRFLRGSPCRTGGDLHRRNGSISSPRRHQARKLTLALPVAMTN
ncbi:hypothetical protein GE09DRAFT_60146 [Coniochaeta sp. 2T2.1]|nr:hypothetical protein GE09DRAFT_60146 [Coniochaeta sp. 2T2.1]